MSEENKNCYVIYTSGLGSRAALQVQSLLDRMDYQDVMLWIPTQKSTITKYGKQITNDKALFPSYIFLFGQLDDSKLEQSLIEAKIGRFLHYPGDDQHPAIISKEDVEHLRSLEEVEVEPVPEEITAIEVGNLVEVCVGPFMGIKGIVTRIAGHMVYVETLVFGRSAPVSFNIAHLSKMSEYNSNEKESAQ
jgi:transcription antitermination factor NusG